MTSSLAICAAVTSFEEDDCKDFENLVWSVSSTVQAKAKSRKENVPPTGADNSAYLQTVWGNEYLQSFAEFPKSQIN